MTRQILAIYSCCLIAVLHTYLTISYTALKPCRSSPIALFHARKGSFQEHQKVARRTRCHASSRTSSNDDNDFSSTSRRGRRYPSIPVIGPILMAPPLYLGEEYILDPPTPLQWRALQESFVAHRNLRLQMKGNATQSNQNISAIDAAPIVAFIDGISGSSTVRLREDSKSRRGKYATLAAVVGIRTKKQQGRNEREQNFMEFYNNIQSSSMITLDSSVRLVGVGRAVIHDFFSIVPMVDVDHDEDEDAQDDKGYDDKTPIVMAEFQSLMDDSSFYSHANINDLGSKEAPSQWSSPIHTLNYLHNLAQNVYRAHDNRRRLVLGILAGKARLRLNEQMRNENEQLDDLKDYDGLGLLFESTSSVVGIDTDDDNKLTEWKTNATVDDDNASHDHVEPLSHMENYGLSYYGFFSRIPDLTTVLMKKVELYYSEDFRDKDEHVLEFASFVAFRSLEGYIDSKDMAWALRCTSSIERFSKALEIMMDHQLKLKQAADYINQKLTECGEECSDLW